MTSVGAFLFAGCASVPNVELFDLTSPELSGASFLSSVLPGDDYDYDESGGSSHGSVPVQSMILAHIGMRQVEEDDWDEEDGQYERVNAGDDVWNEFGITGVHVLDPSGLGIDWSLLSVGFSTDDTVIDTDGDINEIDASVSGLEGQFGLRYLLYANDNFWPFVRGGIILQRTEYEREIFIPSGPTEITLESETFTYGAGVGAGVHFAFGNLRIEIGVGYSWMKSDMDIDATFDTGVIPITVDYEEQNVSFGAEPSVWISIGAGF
jgi:hypothetical protein